METLEDRYCAANRCTAAQFRRRVFWRCLHRRAFPLAPLLLVVNPSYFAPDVEFVSRVAGCQEMGTVWEETRRYFSNPEHKRWLRRKADVRLSAHKLINLAVQYLPVGANPAAAAESY